MTAEEKAKAEAIAEKARVEAAIAKAISEQLQGRLGVHR